MMSFVSILCNTIWHQVIKSQMRQKHAEDKSVIKAAHSAGWMASDSSLQSVGRLRGLGAVCLLSHRESVSVFSESLHFWSRASQVLSQKNLFGICSRAAHILNPTTYWCIALQCRYLQPFRFLSHKRLWQNTDISWAGDKKNKWVPLFVNQTTVV